MITAKEAREKVQSMNFAKNKEQLSRCETAITIAVNNGMCNTTLDSSLTQAVKNQLEILGYKIESGNHYNDQYTSISW